MQYLIFWATWLGFLLGVALAFCLAFVAARRAGLLPRAWSSVAALSVTAAVASVLIILSLAFTLRLDWDELEHLRSAWLIGQGQLPYRDFWQHHTPALWLAMLPLVRILPESVEAVYALRAIATLLTLCTLAVSAWGARMIAPWLSFGVAAMCAGLVYACGATGWAAPVLRPEPPGGLALAAGLAAGYVALARRSRGAALLCGLCVSVAAVMTPKFAPLLVAWPLATLFTIRRGNPGDGARPDLGTWAAWAAGMALPILLQVAWLWRHGLLQEAFYWVFTFNRAMASPLTAEGATVLFLSAPVVLPLWALGIRRLARERHNTVSVAYWVCAMGLGLTGFLASPHTPPYSGWVAVIAAAPPAIVGLETLLVALRRRSCKMRFVVAHALVLSLCCIGLFLVGKRYNIVTAPRWTSAEFREVRDIMETGRGKVVICAIPRHPIFCEDASPVWHGWQVRERGFAHAPAMAPLLREAAEALALGKAEMVDAKAAATIMAIGGDPRLERAWQERVRADHVELSIGESRFFMRRSSHAERPPEAGHAQARAGPVHRMSADAEEPKRR